VCEFKVYLEKECGRVKVAEDVIHAKMEDGKLILVDVLGTTKVFENTIIREVNVGKEELIITTLR